MSEKRYSLFKERKGSLSQDRLLSLIALSFLLMKLQTKVKAH